MYLLEVDLYGSKLGGVIFNDFSRAFETLTACRLNPGWQMRLYRFHFGDIKELLEERTVFN